MSGRFTAVISAAASESGVYVCVVVTSDGQSKEASLEIEDVVTPAPLVSPPTSLKAVWVIGDSGSLGNILVTWEQPVIAEGVTGYKINWGQPGFTDQVALEVFTDDVFNYTIMNLDPASPYAVRVWAFTTMGDQESAQVELGALVVITDATDPTSPTPPPVKIISCNALSPTSAHILWQGSLKDGVSVTYGCAEADTEFTTTLPPSSPFSLQHLLPNCHYYIRVLSENCSLTTPPGRIVTDTNVVEVDGALEVQWRLPPELSVSGERVKVEVNVTGEWVEVDSDTHTMSPSAADGYTLHLRFSLHNWSGILSIPIGDVEPPTTIKTTPTHTPIKTTPTSPVDKSQSKEEAFLLYGAVFAVLLLACVVVVAVILVLKYIQITRRDTDKVTDHRLQQKEHFQRVSMERNSMKKSPYSNGTSNSFTHVTNI
jgi:hypothetical protein